MYKVLRSYSRKSERKHDGSGQPPPPTSPHAGGGGGGAEYAHFHAHGANGHTPRAGDGPFVTSPPPSIRNGHESVHSLRRGASRERDLNGHHTHHQQHHHDGGGGTWSSEWRHGGGGGGGGSSEWRHSEQRNGHGHLAQHEGGGVTHRSSSRDGHGGRYYDTAVQRSVRPRRPLRPAQRSPSAPATLTARPRLLRVVLVRDTRAL